MTTTHPIVVTGNRLQKETSVFIEGMSEAARTFGQGVRSATASYVGGLQTTCGAFAESARGATAIFKGALHDEITDWRSLAIQTRDAYLAAIQKRAGSLEAGVSEAREAVRPASMKVRALEAAHEVLQSAQESVDAHLAQANEAGKTAKDKAPPKAPAKRKPRKATPASRKTGTPSRKADGGVPLRNYDKLTAKDVVARIQRLSPPQASALLVYEQGGKNRATVIRAAKLRATAS